MAKKKTKLKDPVIVNSVPESTDGLKKLKEGTEIMYKTNHLFDRCMVESVDKKTSTAMLSNGVKVSRGILPDGHLLKIGTTTESTEIKVWDDSCELEFKFFMGKRSIANFADKLNKNVSSLGKAEVVFLAEKLEKIEKKYLI